jgi:hypothetical protein
MADRVAIRRGSIDHYYMATGNGASRWQRKKLGRANGGVGMLRAAATGAATRGQNFPSGAPAANFVSEGVRLTRTSVRPTAAERAATRMSAVAPPMAPRTGDPP